MSESQELSTLLQSYGIGKTKSDEYSIKFIQEGVDSVAVMKVLTKAQLDGICHTIHMSDPHRILLDRGLNQHERKAPQEIKKERDEALSEVDKIRELANKFKQAQISESNTQKEEVRVQLDAAVTKLMPDASWRMTLGNEDQCLQVLEKRLVSWSKGTSVGSYPNNFTLVNNISGRSLCKAILLFPGLSPSEFASYANSPLLDHSKHEDVARYGDLRLQSDIQTTHRENTFTKQECFSSYSNELRKGCAHYSMSVEAGCFFGFGAAGVSASSSGASSSQFESRINVKGSTSQAYHTLSEFIHVSTFRLDPNNVNLADEVAARLNEIHLENPAEARNFMRQYGTHILTTDQVIGGTHVRISEVRFTDVVEEGTALQVVNEVAHASGAASGWGVGQGIAAKGDVGGSASSLRDAGIARGQQRHQKESYRNYRDEFVGPDVDDLGVMRQLLESNTRTQHVIDNGLELSAGNSRVCHQVSPIWALFLRPTAFRIGNKNSVDIGKCLRDAWLISAIESPEFNDNDGFFRKMVDYTLATRTAHDEVSWTDKYVRLIRMKNEIGYALGNVSMGSYPNSPVRNTAVNVAFPEAFSTRPRIVLGICGFDCNKSNNTRIRVTAQNITCNGFQILGESWADSTTWLTNVTWIATISPKVATGSVRAGSWPSDPVRSFRRNVNFPSRFDRVPDIWLALSAMDCGSGKNTRINATAENITQAGFTLLIESWADSVTWQVDVDWLASIDDKLRCGSKPVGSWPNSAIRPSTPRSSSALSLPTSRTVIASSTAFSGLDVDCAANTRIQTKLGIDRSNNCQVVAETWADSTVWMTNINYIVQLR